MLSLPGYRIVAMTQQGVRVAVGTERKRQPHGRMSSAFNPTNGADISAANTTASQVCFDVGFDASIIDGALFAEASD